MGFGFRVHFRHFVIPAKAGTQRLCLAPVRSSRQPTHVPVFFTRHPWRASHFLLLAQEKVTKEKGTPKGAVGLWPTARGRYGGSLTGHPWPDSQLAGILPATLRAFSSASSPRPRGTPGIQSQGRAFIGWALAHRSHLGGPRPTL